MQGDEMVCVLSVFAERGVCMCVCVFMCMAILSEASAVWMCRRAPEREKYRLRRTHTLFYPAIS